MTAGESENTEPGKSLIYRDAHKSLARPWQETSYSNQDLKHYTKNYGEQTTGIYLEYSFFPSKVGLKTYQHPGITSQHTATFVRSA